jgi:sialate O-acetylesterase
MPVSLSHRSRIGRLACSTLMITTVIWRSGFAEELNLTTLDLSEMTQGWSVPGVNKTVAGNPLRMGGKTFTTGIGTHADASLALDLKGAAKRFTALVGVDDETGGGGSVAFTVVGDGKTLWSSGTMKGKDAPKAIDLELSGIKKLIITIGATGDGYDNDHADIADPVITYQGKAPSMATPSLPHIFSDHMVLQRDRPVPVWGWATTGETVQVSFGTQMKKATVDAAGKWMVRLDAMPANKIGQDLVISGGESANFKNVVVGDVWICSGQSNMEFGVGGSLNAQAEAAAATNPLIRFVYVPRVVGAFPLNDFKGTWQVATPATVGGCTAVGYFFARELAKELEVPIGLIHSNWGGTAIEPWIPREGFAGVPELKDFSKRIDDTYPDSAIGIKNFQDYLAKMRAWIPLADKALANQLPPPPMPAAPPGTTANNGGATNLYNAMIAPTAPFGIKGAIWYQGESNGGEGDTYYHKMKALIGGWRQVWGQGDFPFYWVQLANFQNSDPSKPEMGDGWARVREAQLKSLTIPNTGMAVITDVGDAKDIHPKNKQDVGKRLAAWALAKDYGKKGEYSGPLFQTSSVQGNSIRITFAHADSGLMIGEKSGLDPVKEVIGGKLKWLSVAGADRKFYWAEAVLDGKTLIVSSDQVAMPVAVRYAFTMNPQGPMLYNKEGFPASPFRTDAW